ncbi:MAG: efflux RND transporter periplasmic adaptor subunit [Pseudomonadota bacterium]
MSSAQTFRNGSARFVFRPGLRLQVSGLLALLFLSSLAPALGEDGLRLSQTQLDALGVRFEAPVATQSATGSAWSGLVSIPPAGFEQVVAPLQGRVLSVAVAAGDEVKAGQVLLRMFSPDWVALSQALQSAQTTEGLAAQTLTREQRLFKEGIGIERRVREAEAALQQARIEREAAAARLRGAGGAPDKQALNEAELVIRAPRAGRVLNLSALPGAWLNAGEGVASISSSAERWVEADVPVSVANTLRIGQRASVDAALNANVPGKVLAIGSVVEVARQTVSVRVALENAEVLRPGLRVSLRFEDGVQQALWRVPRAALVQVDGALSVFVKRAEQVLPLAVKTQGMSEVQPAIQATLAAGDQVAVEGAVLLKGAWDGRVTEGATGSAAP